MRSCGGPGWGRVQRRDPLPLRDNRRLRDAGESEHALIALNFFGGTQPLLKVVGKLHCRIAIGVVELTHQVYWIETASALRIAVAEIIGQQRAPTCAETYAPFGNPVSRIEKVASLPKIIRGSAVANRPGKIGMQSENRIHVERIG